MNAKKTLTIFVMSVVTSAQLLAVDNATLSRAMSRMVADINTLQLQINSDQTEIVALKNKLASLTDENKNTNDKLLLTQEELSKTKSDIDLKTQGLRDESNGLIGASTNESAQRMKELKDRLFKLEGSLNGGADISNADVEKRILDYIKE